MSSSGSTFRALRHPNYRLWVSGAFVSNIGTWMQRVAQDWLVLTVLTDHDGTAVGITTGLQFLPILFLAPYAGVLSDRLSKRRLLIATQSALGLLGLLQGILVLSGTAELWHIYLIALGLGIASALDAPARQAFVSEVVHGPDVANAVALNSASFNLGRLAGPGAAGVLIGFMGTGPVFIINAVSFAAVLISLLLMKPALLHPTARVPRGKHQIRDGIAYVKDQPRLVVIMTAAFLVGTFTLNFQITNALMATTVFHEGPDAYGYLGSIMAIGTLAGAFLAARRAAPRMVFLAGGALMLGISVIVAAVMPGYLWYAALLIPVGLASITFLNSANTIIQLSTAPQYRGRVLALYMTVIQGGTALGSPLTGWIGHTYGARWALISGGIAALIAGIIGLIALSRWKGGGVRHQLRTVWAARGRSGAKTPVAVLPELAPGSRKLASG